MVHGMIVDDGSLALVILDMRNPADGGSTVPVEVSASSGLGGDAPRMWQLSIGSRLTSETLDSTQSRLTAPGDVIVELADERLAPGEPLRLTSESGSVTVLNLEVADASTTGPSDGSDHRPATEPDGRPGATVT